MGKVIKCVGKILEKYGVKDKGIMLYEKIYEYIRTLQMYVLYPADCFFNKRNKLDIMTIDETIQYILDNNCSVSRYGDGEFNMISNHSIGFQKANDKLVEELRENVYGDKESDCLICLPGIFSYEEEYEKSTKKFWNKILVHTRKEWYGYCNHNYRYGNADITRCYIELKDRNKSDYYFEMIKKIWENKDIIIIEGEKSRLGVGNDLFKSTNSIRRILCPSIDAFSRYDVILKYVLDNISKKTLILIALGPTASIMSVELSKLGYQAIDIGNIDKEYEWCKARTKCKVRNPLKFTMEVKDGIHVEECNDKKYLEEILYRIV